MLFASSRSLALGAHAVRALAGLVWLLGRPVVIDTETTDLDGEIIEIAVVDGRTGRVVFSSLLRPTRPINPEAAAKHHISAEMCAGAPTWQQVWPRVARLLRWRVICAWNAPFDRARVTEACRSTGLPASAALPSIWWCLMRAEAAARRGRWRRLDSGHRAVDDALAAQHVLSNLRGRGPFVGPGTASPRAAGSGSGSAAVRR